MFSKDELLGGIYGFITGDALGVPVEFKSRKELKNNPVIDMRGNGTHNQPKGTWSDDTSMVLATMDAMSRNIWGAGTIMENFYRWLTRGDFTATGGVFDVGTTTVNAINEYAMGERPENCGGDDVMDNGNGSVMRMLPLIYYVYATWGENITPVSVNFIETISSLTHAHIISRRGCVYYVYAGIYIMRYGKRLGLNTAIKSALTDVEAYYGEAVPNFSHIGSLELSEDDIKSTGYVVDSLEACLWCLYTTKSYKKAVLRAVNLGGDTDTIGAITGALAGLYYGYDSIPKEWIKDLQNKELINNLCDKFYDKFR